MALRRVEAGGQPVYVIEVDVPKVTDSRGKGYGTLVSDLRWKLWEEVQASQLQQMKYEQMSKQAQLDVLEQKQRDISRAIRDARELQSKIKAGTVSPTAAASLYLQAQKANQIKTTVTREPVTTITGKVRPGQFKETTRVTTPSPIGLPQEMMEGVEAATVGASEAALQDAERQRERLDEYIADLEREQTATGEEFRQFVATGIAPQDLLSRTRQAFQTQIGEGGFGISRRPLRELSRFDELEAVGLIQDTLAREEEALIRDTEAQVIAAGGAPLGPQQMQDLRMLARERLKAQMEAEGARPTSRAGFLMKEMPPSPQYVPSTPERPPIPRGDVGVVSATPRDREIEILQDISGRRAMGEDVTPLIDELQDVRATRRSLVPASEPVDAAIARQAELDALGATPDEMESFRTIPGAAGARARTQEAIDIAAEERLAAGRLPRDRGFSFPVEPIAGVTTTTGGRPGGLMDRLTASRLGRTQDVSGSPPATPPMVTSTPTTSVPQVQPPATMEEAPLFRSGPIEIIQEASPLPEAGTQEDIGAGRFIIHDGRGGGTVYEMSNGARKTLFTTSALGKEGEVVTPEMFKTRVKELKKGGAQDLGKTKSTTQRRELYAMNTIKKGLELADKPKQFARLAKTDNPVAAPEYIKLVNGVYEMNGTSPNRFKLTYDEVARVYRDDDKTREKALSYLVAKDAIESNVTRPMV